MPFLDRPASVEKSSFGRLPDGRAVSLFTLAAGAVRVRLSDFGGIITGIETPDRDGVSGDIALGFDRLEDYLADTAYHGAICGRTCNRIGRGRFILDGHEYRLAVNNGPNNNHGGVVGFNRILWTADMGVTPVGAFVRLRHLSPDGHEGYPGNLSVDVTYTLKNSGVFRMEFSATTDAPTPVNLTNHTYFNLAGHAAGDFSGHLLQANASRYLPADEDGLVTGEVLPVEDSPFDFRRPRRMGDPREPHPHLFANGYNNNLVTDNAPGVFSPVARVVDPVSGRTLTISTTEPGLQYYNGYYLDCSPPAGKGGARYGRKSGFALETQHWPDAPNRPGFPSVIVRPGEVFRTVTEWEFGVWSPD